ncbi:cytochrome P450 [Nocardiopsis sp. RSe5-2]|uniref:Cytochrome P450 n=1 Tax=Nocardiopsis endophytica TaxID=3018445 RepID=A0ABT4U6V0_9ACTN|nr:cytochrome P450 [Nocardiopsis endophytica]MDA2812165.1 cytochrome P450 [Nocardiopsis endophytica]
MTTAPLPELPEMPTARPAGRPFAPPEELAAVRPLARIPLADGSPGWLVTGFAAARAVTSDPRFSNRMELQRLVLPRAGMPDRMPPAPPGMFLQTDPPEHTRYRRLLAGRFTVRRMRLLTEGVERTVAEHLDAMERAGGTADLVAAYAQPIPALVICEILGVPTEDHDRFQENTRAFNDPAATAEEMGRAMQELAGYLRDLVNAKRAAPTDDILSELTDSDLTEEELVNVATLLLGAGLDTTANMIALGTYALLRHPDQLAVMRDDPEAVDGGVEELMRYLSIAHTGQRAALEDVELEGHMVKEGDIVALSMAAANRDPERFPDPDRLDLRREAPGHIGFGHGVHQCLGQQLARVEMRAAFPALLRRFPDLRLAVPEEEVPLRSDSDIYGVDRLPVAWGPEGAGR